MSRSQVRVAPVAGVNYDTDEMKGGSVFTTIPLLVISLLLFTIGRFAGGPDWPAQEMLSLQMVSGDVWSITFGNGFTILSMGFLFVELLRSTRTGTDSLINHALSALLFIAGLLLFIIVKGFGNSTFFIFLCMAFLDFMAGFIVTTVTARRDFGVAN